jgi:hypothetical protein
MTHSRESFIEWFQQAVAPRLAPRLVAFFYPPLGEIGFKSLLKHLFFSIASRGNIMKTSTHLKRFFDWKTCLSALAVSFAVSAVQAEVNTTGLAVTDTTVKVGILHSVTGTMAISETGSVQAEKLAIDQINAMGGVLGRKIEFIQEDGASDWPTFAEKSKKLLVNDKVAAVFG